jgi:hypothetical protein
LPQQANRAKIDAVNNTLQYSQGGLVFKFRYWLVLGILALLVIPSTGVMAQRTRTAQWTIIYYMALDNDLEPFAINDLLEMQTIGSTDEVNIIVQFDRAEGYEEFFGNWTDARRFRIEQATRNRSTGDFAVDGRAMAAYFSQFEPSDFGISRREFNQQIEQLENASPTEAAQVALNQVVPLAEGAPKIPLQQEAIDSVGETNTGDPDDLVDFALWTMQEYPAENYALIISDHGTGWAALANDESENGDPLTLPELSEALENITQRGGIDQFDLIGFDACLEAQMDVMLAIAPYGKYALASEQTIPGAGWNYVTPLRALTDDPDIDVRDLGKVFVDSYIQFYDELAVEGWSDYSLAMHDLSQMRNLTEAITAFSEVIAENESDDLLKALSDARRNVQVFASDTPDVEDYISSVDLVHYMELVNRFSDIREVKNAADNVIRAVEQVVIYQRETNLRNANGLTVYFPRNERIYNRFGRNYEREAPQGMIGWQNFLATFYGKARRELPAANLNIEFNEVYPTRGDISIHDPAFITMSIEGEAIAEVEFAVVYDAGEGFGVMIDQYPLAPTTLTEEGEPISTFNDGTSDWFFTWNVQMPIISDGENASQTLLLPDPQAPNLVRISGYYHPAGGDERRNAYMVFNVRTREFINLWINSENGSPFTQNPRPGDRFEPIFRFIDPDGEEQLIPSEILLNINSPELALSYIPALDGDYTLYLKIEDAAGNIKLATRKVKVDNGNLDSEYRGFKNMYLGVNFLFPWDWSDPLITINNDNTLTISIRDLENEVHIYLNVFEEVESLDELVDAQLERHETILDDFEPQEQQTARINRREFVIVPYTFTSSVDNRTRYGVLAMVYNEDTEKGFVIDLDTVRSRREEAQAIFERVLDSLEFFEPIESPN